MIERLRTTITGIVSLDPQASRPNQKLLDDCADAVRLQLDCMQQEMLSPQRVSLELLLDVLDDSTSTTQQLIAAARQVSAALGIPPTLLPPTA